MMISFRNILLGAFISFTPLVVQAAPAPQPQISFTAGASGTWNADWNGVVRRVYFLQWSLDLVNWQFAPFMEFDTGIKSRGVATANAPKFFVRLVYYDDPSLLTLTDAMNADFDHDGVSNFDEINSLGTNPFLRSTRGTGVPDGVPDSDNDGISDADEAALGLDPNVSNTGPTSGSAAINYSYDDINRLVGVTSPVMAKTYTLDQEGNIEGQ